MSKKHLDLRILYSIKTGERFSYTYYDQTCGEIWKSIEVLDKKGMDLIETLEPVDFKNYLKEYDNTICGNHPISVLLNVCLSFENF
jgi:predicted class III extradiol MEMO1 family dioxygenase